MSNRLPRIFAEEGLTPLDDQTVARLSQALLDERVPQPDQTNARQLRAILTQRLAMQSGTQSVRFRDKMEQDRRKAMPAWPVACRSLYRVLNLVQPQIHVLTWAFWLSSAVIMSLGVMMLPENFRFTALLLVAPLLAVVSVAYAFRSFRYGVVEWERSCPITPGDLVMARLLVVVLYDIILSTVASVLLYPSRTGAPFAWIIFAWLAPLLGFAGITLLVSLRYGHLPAITTGSLLWLVFALANWNDAIQLTHGPGQTLVWAILAVGGMACMVMAVAHINRWSVSYGD